VTSSFVFGNLKTSNVDPFPCLRSAGAMLSGVVPVDLHIRGCPPTPTDLLKGLLALLERPQK
jgi:Ni,Fe-hydrogenase III small subunit